MLRLRHIWPPDIIWYAVIKPSLYGGQSYPRRFEAYRRKTRSSNSSIVTLSSLKREQKNTNVKIQTDLRPILLISLPVGTVVCRQIGNACVCQAVRAYDSAWAKYHHNAQMQTVLVPRSSSGKNRTSKKRTTKTTARKMTTTRTTQPTTATLNEAATDGKDQLRYIAGADAK